MEQDIQELIRLASEDNQARIRAAARLMSLVENFPERTPELFTGLSAWSQTRMVVGLTGSPGSGKSVLVDRLIAGFRGRHPERRIGIIAVDPSSPLTGGALLGDRVRMMRHATDPLVFIRSSATRGCLGGLMSGAVGLIQIMSLIGCDVILIETVGVGQGEVDIAQIADLVTVVLAPNHGDSIQLLKAGLIEIGDIFVINKADQPGAAPLYAQLLATLRLANSMGGARRPADICLVNALEDRGICELIEQFECYYAREHEHWPARRKAALQEQIRQAIFAEFKRRLAQAIGPDVVQRVLRGEVTIADLVKQLSLRLAMANNEVFERAQS